MITQNEANAVVTLIDIMLQRGAIRGDEVVQVASLRQRFVQFANQATETEETTTDEE